MGPTEPLQPKGEEEREPSGQKRVRADQVPHSHTRHLAFVFLFCCSVLDCPLLVQRSFGSPLTPLSRPGWHQEIFPPVHPLPTYWCSRAHLRPSKPDKWDCPRRVPKLPPHPAQQWEFPTASFPGVFIREQNLATCMQALCGVLQQPSADFSLTHSSREWKTQNESRSGGGAHCCSVG